jgi:hypothetical protein
MTSPKVISPEFLLWSQLLLLWSFAAYGMMADFLREETADVRWKGWVLLLSARAILAATLAYLLSRSIVLSGLLFLTVVFQPLLRYLLPMRLLAEFEGLWTATFMVCSLAVIRQFRLPPRLIPVSISPAQLAALCIIASTLLVVVRGGTYIVRGILGKSGTLPSKKQLNTNPPPQTLTPVDSLAASVDQSSQSSVDFEEYNRGRLIGNLERIVLTIVMAAGSYAALAFLIAAKGVVRSDEFSKNRDFAEYFLIGSLSSVLVALCAGIALRVALIHLWPDLLGLQIQ